MSQLDMMHCYYVLTKIGEQSFGRLAFELIKLNPYQKEIGKDDLVYFCTKVANMSEIYLSQFYKIEGFDPREMI